ncbi:MAG: ABC transporter permease [Clostridia bacterium]|nr:ABC transporter permease [Clostridia bacterium]
MTGVSDSLVIATREVIRGLREKSRLFGSIARPVVWLFLLGTGLRGSFGGVAGVDYIHYIFPGILVMNILFASIMAGTSIIWDREFGFLKEILVAPVSRISIAVGKTLGGSIMSTIQGLIVLVFYPFIGIRLSIAQLTLTLCCMFLISFCITALGILIAVRMRSFEGFGVMNNFVVMPMFFLSGAMYPINHVPVWIKILTRVNPVYYCVDLVRPVMLGLTPDNSIWANLGFLGVFATIVLGIAVFLFRLEGS